MATIRIEIETDNASFQDGGGHWEVARILRRLADDYANYGLADRPLRDANGNRVGAARLVEHCTLEDLGDDPLGAWHGKNE
jgi:hypothetical protein